MKKIIATAILATALALPGCYSVTVKTGKSPNGVEHSERSMTFVAGLIPSGTITPPCEPSMVKTSRGIIDYFITGLTLGLVAPVSVDIACAETPKARQAARRSK